MRLVVNAELSKDEPQKTVFNFSVRKSLKNQKISKFPLSFTHILIMLVFGNAHFAHPPSPKVK